MQQQVSLALRWTRALVLALVAFTTGLAAHVSAGGNLPGPVVLVVLVLVASLPAAALLGRPAGTSRVIALVVFGQTAVHAALTGTAGHKGDPVSTRTPVPVQTPTSGSTPAERGSYYDVYAQGVPGGEADAGPVLPAWALHLVADLTGPHALMAAAHLVAAAVVGWWLARGERALWTLLTLAAYAVARVVRPRVHLPTRADVDVTDWRPAPERRAPVLLQASRPSELHHRGPPALLAA